MNNKHNENNSLEASCMAIGTMLIIIAIFIIIVLLASLIVGCKVLTIIGITLLATGVIIFQIARYASNS